MDGNIILTNQSTLGSMQLKVIIVGGGIGGLTAAVALRKQGHEVHVYEQSQFANETGAAIHIAPNANGVLLSLGINHEEWGGIRLRQTRLLTAAGEHLATQDHEAESHQWQQPWIIAHRAHLHAQLKQAATSITGEGGPVRLHTSSRIVRVDPHNATILLENGELVQGDIVVGADGVNSNCRLAICDKEFCSFKTDASAFRFLVPLDKVLEDPKTHPVAREGASLDLYYGADRKVVIYPCANSTLLNFVCIHPASLSDATGDDYDNVVSNKEKLLDVYKEFNQPLRAVMDKCDPDTLRLYPLFDLETLPTFVNDRLVLIGDAAHPFTPHLAQGGAMAIEDAVSLSVMLSCGVLSSEVPERLKLYNKARYERGTLIQGFSRITGGDGLSSGSRKVDNFKVREYLNYGLSHDERHASTQILREYKWSASSMLHWRQPVVFGPMPGPRQHLQQIDPIAGMPLETSSLTATIKFKTSATLLRNMFPSKSYSFVFPDTVALASLTIRSMKNVEWLCGGSYESMSFQIHGVKYTQSDGSILRGSYCPVIFENDIDSIVTGREELGLPKLFSDIDVQATSSKTLEVSVSQRRVKWASFWLRGLSERRSPEHPQLEKTNSDSSIGEDGLLVHKYIPTTAEIQHRDKFDAEYDVFVPCQVTKVDWCQESLDAGFAFFPRGKQELPTLHHIVDRLAEVPVFEVVDASLINEQGMRGMSAAPKVIGLQPFKNGG